MEAIRDCWDLAGQFGRRMLSWIHLAEELPPPTKADFAGFALHDVVHDEEEGDVCAICTEPLDEGGDTLRLPCNDKHVFHHACMRQWACVSMSCPLDRRPIPPEALLKLSIFNHVRLHASLFLEEVISGASQYLMFSNLWHDFPVNFLSLAIGKCSSSWVERIDNSLYAPAPQGGPQRQGAPLPAWSRTGVLKAGEVAFHVLLWTAYSSIGYTSLVLHYLLRRSFETGARRVCTRAIQLSNVGYDYGEAKQLLAKTKWSRVIKGIGFLLGLVVVGREVRRGSARAATSLMSHVNNTVPMSFATPVSMSA